MRNRISTENNMAINIMFNKEIGVIDNKLKLNMSAFEYNFELYNKT